MLHGLHYEDGKHGWFLFIYLLPQDETSQKIINGVCCLPVKTYGIERLPTSDVVPISPTGEK